MNRLRFDVRFSAVPRPALIAASAALVAFATLALRPTSATAQIDFRWADPNGGAFNDPNNWQSLFPGAIPDFSVQTIFQLPNAYTVTFPADQMVHSGSIRNGNVVFGLDGSTYRMGQLLVGELADDVAELTIRQGTLDANHTKIGMADPSVGAVVVDEGGRLMPASLNVGDGGTGTLRILNGGLVESAILRIGDLLTGNGAVDVLGTDASGNRSTLSARRVLVGVQGDGALRIADGAHVLTNPDPSLDESDSIGLFPSPEGNALGATGLVTIDGVAADGTPSAWIGGGRLLMGNVAGTSFAQGIMTITGGARATHGEAVIQGADEAPSRVDVRGTDADGNPSMWTLQGGGLELNGEVLVGDGGAIEIPDHGVVMAQIEDSASRLTVSGANALGIRSRLVGRSFTVGQEGTADLEISAGAIVVGQGAGGSLTIASRETSDGTVRISGRDAAGNPASLTLSDRITVGLDGAATLKISDGGTLTTGFDTPISVGFVAFRPSSTASIEVTGDGSMWSHARDLYLGGSVVGPGGEVDFHVDNDARVEVGGTLKVWNRAELELNGGLVTVGRFEMADGGMLRIGIAGDAASESNGQLVVENDAMLDGLLAVELRDAFLPEESDAYAVVVAADLIRGIFANVAPGGRLLTDDRLGSFQVDYGDESPFAPNEIVLSRFRPLALTADFDLDGDVDGDDFLRWQAGFGIGTTHGEGDADGDADTDGDDFLVWQGQFGASAEGAAATISQSVPEPTTAWLVFLAVLAGAASPRGGNRLVGFLQL